MNKSILYKAKEDKDIQEDLRKLKVLQKEPCEDAISRQALLEFFKDDDYVVNEINNMPSVLPKRKQGKWRQNGTGYDDEPIYECSKCGKRVIFGEDGYFKGCPYCFAEMTERSENEMR